MYSNSFDWTVNNKYIYIPGPPRAHESGQPAHPGPGFQPRPRRRGLLEPERAVVALVLPLPAAQGPFTYDVRTRLVLLDPPPLSPCPQLHTTYLVNFIAMSAFRPPKHSVGTSFVNSPKRGRRPLRPHAEDALRRRARPNDLQRGRHVDL